MFVTRVDDRQVVRNLTNLGLLLSDAGLAAFLTSTIGPYLSKRAEARFKGEGDDVVGKWEPLSRGTEVMRAEQGYPAGPINHRSGELEEWVVNGGWQAYPFRAGAQLTYPNRNPTGELAKKVETAQKGRKFPATNPRPVLGVNEADLLFLQSSLALAINEVQS